MKRDLNLIRDLLLFYESDCSVAFPPADEESVRQHLAMLVEAGLLDGRIVGGGTGSPQYVLPKDGREVARDGQQYLVFRVTWGGHEFLAAARDNQTWNRAMKAIGPTVGAMTLGLVKEYLEHIVRKSLGLG